MSHRNLLLLLFATTASYICYARADRNPYVRYVADGFRVVDHLALQDPPDEELFNGAMLGMIEVLRAHDDQHSQFIPALKRDAEREEIRQEFAGVGIHLQALGDPPLPTVLGPPEADSPAEAGGLTSGDKIVAVDGKPSSNYQYVVEAEGESVARFNLEEFTRSVRGPVGEPVTLSIKRGDEPPHDVTLERGVVNVPSIRGDLRDGQGHWDFRLKQHSSIGYLRITKFGDKTASEVEAALTALVSEPIDGVILDVRDNPGGVMDAAVSICNLLLKSNLPIVTTRDREGRELRREISTDEGEFLDLPLAVLINRDSASASEIVAACLQDWQRAVVIGERSYGKGTVQSIVPLESGRSEIRITSATYWRPSGRNIHRMPGDGEQDDWGVEPDPGFKVVLDNEENQARQVWRIVRDFVGEATNSPLALELTKDLDQPNVGFTDRALVRAIKHLQTLQQP